MNKVKDKLISNSLRMLYCTLVLPYINYCSEIWGNTYKSRIQELVKLQKRAIRIVGKVGYREHSEPEFYKYKCLKLEDIITLKTGVVMFKAYNGLFFNT